MESHHFACYGVVADEVTLEPPPLHSLSHLGCPPGDLSSPVRRTPAASPAWKDGASVGGRFRPKRNHTEVDDSRCGILRDRQRDQPGLGLRLGIAI